MCERDKSTFQPSRRQPIHVEVRTVAESERLLGWHRPAEVTECFMVKGMRFIAYGIAVLAVGCATQRLPPPSGEDMYALHCVSCHGPTGEGDQFL